MPRRVRIEREGDNVKFVIDGISFRLSKFTFFQFAEEVSRVLGTYAEAREGPKAPPSG